jgi:hypothetical protein
MIYYQYLVILCGEIIYNGRRHKVVIIVNYFVPENDKLGIDHIYIYIYMQLDNCLTVGRICFEIQLIKCEKISVSE